MYYRPDMRSVCADVIPFYEDGEFKLFYLKDYRDLPNKGEGCPWHLLTTKNLVDYEDKGVVLPRGKVTEQDLYVFTGCCIKKDDTYYIFYTGHNPHLRRQNLPEQKIMLATSKDMLHWEKDGNFLFEAPDWMEMHDFRDPFVFFNEEEGKYAMLIAGRFKGTNPTFSKGATFVAYSEDLINWEVSKTPFYAPDAYFAHECPDLFKMGDWWYLIFSEFTDKIATRYRMAKSLKGPWITPKQDTFDGHAFYAAKSTTDGKRRILFGWNCIKLHEEDDNWWQWGGTIIPHELIQAEDGTLSVAIPEEIAAQYTKKMNLEEGFVLGSVEKTETGYNVGKCNDGMHIQMLNYMPANCKIEMEFTCADEIGEFGVILRESCGLDFHYKVKFEPRYNRLTFDKIPRKDMNTHSLAEHERYCPIIPGRKNTITIIVEESVLEVYVNDQVAMSARMFDMKIGNFGVYTQNTKVAFDNISLYVQE